MALTYKPKMGDKFTLHKVFSRMSFGECEVVSISPSEKWFKVNGIDKSFSAKNLHSKGSTMTSGYYLVPVR